MVPKHIKPRPAPLAVCRHLVNLMTETLSAYSLSFMTNSFPVILLSYKN